LSRCAQQRMLHELGPIGNTHGLSTEEELNGHYSERLKFLPQAQALYNSKKANKRKRTAEMVKDAMYRTPAVEMFHRGRMLVRKEILAYNPNDHAHAVMDPCNGWCSHCSRQHLESFGADPFHHPTDCPKLAQFITDIFDGNAGGHSLFVGHDTMVDKRESLKNSTIFLWGLYLFNHYSTLRQNIEIVCNIGVKSSSSFCKKSLHTCTLIKASLVTGGSCQNVTLLKVEKNYLIHYQQ
jgi:hypothetical protein